MLLPKVVMIIYVKPVEGWRTYDNMHGGVLLEGKLGCDTYHPLTFSLARPQSQAAAQGGFEECYLPSDQELHKGTVLWKNWSLAAFDLT